MKRSVRAYFNEAKWLHEEYAPTIEEYLSVAQVTSEVTLFTVICFVGMGRMAPKRSLNGCGMTQRSSELPPKL